MNETNEVTCMLCGEMGSSTTMSPAGCPTVGHHLDFAMAVKWFCADPCFKEYRSNPHLQTRVHQWQDGAAEWARASIQSCSDETLCEMENLPEGLKITPSERARWSVLKDNLEDIEALQDDEDNALLHKICRNINKNSFRHPQTGMIKDYETLLADFEELEKLTSEERRNLN